MNEGTIAMHSDLFVVWLFMHCGLTTDLEEAGWRDISQETMELISEGVSNTFEAMDYLSTTSPPWALSSPLKEKCMAAFLVHHFPRQEDSKHFHRDGVFCVPELQLHGRDKLLGTPDGVFIGKEEVNEKAKLRVLGALDIGRGADKHIQSIQYGRNLIHLDQDNSEPTKIKLILELNFPFSAPRLSSSSFRLYGMVPSIKESGSMLQWCQLLEGDVTRQNLTNVFRAFFFTNVNFHKLSKEPSHPVNLRVQRIHNSAYKLVNKTASKSVEYSKTYLNATVSEISRLKHTTDTSRNHYRSSRQSIRQSGTTENIKSSGTVGGMERTHLVMQLYSSQLSSSCEMLTVMVRGESHC